MHYKLISYSPLRTRLPENLEIEKYFSFSKTPFEQCLYLNDFSHSLDFVFNHLPHKTKPVILSLGCGAMLELSNLSKKLNTRQTYFDYIGIDLEPLTIIGDKMIKQCPFPENTIRYLRHDATDHMLYTTLATEYPDEQFIDLILLRNPKPSDMVMWRNLLETLSQRHLTPDGMVLISHYDAYEKTLFPKQDPFASLFERIPDKPFEAAHIYQRKLLTEETLQSNPNPPTFVEIKTESFIARLLRCFGF